MATDSARESFLEFYRRAPFTARAKILVCFSLAALIGIATTWTVGVILGGGRRKSVAEETIQRHRARVVVSPSFTHTYELRDIAIPLSDRASLRSAHAQFTLVLDCPSAEIQKRMIAERPNLLDGVIQAGAQLTLEDFQTEDGFEKLRSAILKELGARLGQDGPREVAIKSWFLQ